ncbi:hypothetical protein LTR09_005670 [Extremus antarcticus]|uniref:N-acetyltransferase domain-containing protein n=1 Tax=Extremus antarcticus TaxID=702011 RepID=A0AAJ0GC36_9PEZI|nr:hypothetical protein LTR09_005670 [Extremus antarcticus]
MASIKPPGLPAFEIRVAAEHDIPALTALIIPTFAHYHIEQMLGNHPSAIEAASARHLRAHREHIAETGEASGIKCMALDPNSGEEVMAACAYWYFFPHPRSQESMDPSPNYLLSADWVPEENGEREKMRRCLQPVLTTRRKWVQGRGHAILMFMATEPAWRRQGAATAVVRWGLERCRELGIPAFLEASEEGAPVYKGLGFEVVDTVVMEVEGERAEFPVMMWWPPGTEEWEKKPLGE